MWGLTPPQTPHKGRFFTFGLGQDKVDKEDLVTREKNRTKLGSVAKNHWTLHSPVFRKKSSLSTAPLQGGVGGGSPVST